MFKNMRSYSFFLLILYVFFENRYLKLKDLPGRKHANNK